MEPRTKQQDLPRIHFLRQRYAINGSPEGKWTARAHRILVKQLQDSLASLRRLTSAHLYWVPGHADVDGNEAADQLAKQGATANPPANLSLDQAKSGLNSPPSPSSPDYARPPAAKKARMEDLHPESPGPGRAVSMLVRRGQRTRRPPRTFFPGIEFSVLPQTSRKRTRTDSKLAAPNVWKAYLANIQDYIYPDNWPEGYPCIHGCIPSRLSLPDCHRCRRAIREHNILPSLRTSHNPSESFLELPDLPFSLTEP